MDDAEGRTVRAPRELTTSAAASGFEVPEEIRRTTGGASHATGCVLAAIFVLFPAFVYFGFFGLVLLDDLILGTHYVSERLPPAVLEWLVVIYAPLIYLTRRALGIQ